MLGHTAHFRRKLLAWYHQNRRDLPWRISRNSSNTTPNPYLVLVSEAMLQQTQVATVIPYFDRFIKAFPTLTHLASASEQHVLRLWQGLGYYSRARNLLATAKMVQNLGGQLPTSVEELLKLPGVGRYTAGAISSIAFNRRSPILDGNVTRVLSRLDLFRDPNKESLWRRAEELLPKTNCGDFNSALMELGATICTPHNPKCDSCPIQSHCAAQAAGVQEQIPQPSPKKFRPLERRLTLAISLNNNYLIEQRPPTGRWANMWQFITIKNPTTPPTPASLSKIIGLRLSSIRQIGALQHNLTHRRYHFQILACRANPRTIQLSPNRRWVGLDGLSDFPLPQPHLKVAKLIASLTQASRADDFLHFLSPKQKSPPDLADASQDEVPTWK
jgi:A/G-specific adenine glycosylase